MTIQTRTDINTLLQQADLEGLIATGAPADEYETEAQDIASALAEMDAEQINAASVTAIIAAIWAKSFNLDERGVNARLSAIKTLAERITASR